MWDELSNDINAFEVGDVVQLKSGGPGMTVKFVSDVFGTQAVSCIWFNHAGDRVYGDVFYAATLKKL